MSATVRNENGGAMTEVTHAAASIGSAGSIRVTDTAQDTSASSARQARILHTLKLVWLVEDIFGRRVWRNLAGRYRTAFAAEPEHELSDDALIPELCRTCQQYPAAWCGRCFSCNADRRLPA